MTGAQPHTPLQELRRIVNAEIDRLSIAHSARYRYVHQIEAYQNVLNMINAIEAEDRIKNTARMS